mgnify:CR=1 FL=1
MKKMTLSVAIIAALYTTPILAAGISGDIEEVFVSGKATDNSLAGKAEAASVGTVLAEQIEHRPILRPAEILETIPGMVITQHSGGGKANQYFLRGFNLDHSTDFASFIEGAPVNMVSHGHGQGYTDLNFLIPELLDRLVYKKGPYYASSGDFSSAGSAHIYYAQQKQSNKIKLTVGEYGYERGLFVGGAQAGDGDLVYALEYQTNDGPWTNPEDLTRNKGFIKYTLGDKSNGFSVSALYFDSDWIGTDQIPQRLVNDGTLGRYDTLDNDTGGDTHRYQIALQQWADLSETSRIKSNLYVIDYNLNLTSNFSYYAGDDTVTANGGHSDQFVQFDERLTYGGQMSIEHEFADIHLLDLGLSLRFDDIKNVGVGKSENRKIYAMDTHAAVEELSYSMFTSVHSQWTDWFASIVGLRYDRFEVDVDAISGTAQSGKADDDIVTPKLSLHFGPLADTNFFVNYGRGFHSNDARGVVADDVPLLSESQGYEFGLQNNSIDNLHLSAVLFHLELDSELVFVGDEGTTEPKDGSKRRGIELSMYYQPLPWMIIDADYTKSEAKFKKTQVEEDNAGNVIAVLGDYVPDSIEDVFSMGMSLESELGVYGGLRLRYFGPRNLDEAGAIKSDSSRYTLFKTNTIPYPYYALR